MPCASRSRDPDQRPETMRAKWMMGFRLSSGLLKANVPACLPTSLCRYRKPKGGGETCAALPRSNSSLTLTISCQPCNKSGASWAAGPQTLQAWVSVLEQWQLFVHATSSIAQERHIPELGQGTGMLVYDRPQRQGQGSCTGACLRTGDGHGAFHK
jgi:hypothetical protein